MRNRPGGERERSSAVPRRTTRQRLRALKRTARAGRPDGGAHPTGGHDGFSPLLWAAAAYAWRLLVVGAAVYIVFMVLGRFHLVTLAVFLALVVTALLGPLTDLLHRWMPRSAAVALGLLLALVLVLGVLSLIGANVAAEWEELRRQFGGDLARTERWLEGAPFHLRHGALARLQSRVSQYVATHGSSLFNAAVSGVGQLVDVLTTGVLALFCSVFFLHSGDRMWRWFGGQLPERRRSAARAGGYAAWTTFTGYTRGIVVVAATNAVLVGLALFFLGVPLVLPLAVLEFFAAFIPLVGSPIALAVATVVALAAKGPLIALVLILLIVVIGQIEGHVLHPLVMSRAVRLHPVVVALSVICGAVTAGVLGAVVAVPLVSVLWSVYGVLRTTDL
ncbi:AI-2E family transporter [Streptomyces gilvosporeus]|uniref:AI-2E family transporter n=1 Tax=Streptomyces gilvosporeus TaxID=553510 RepID=A0A1V0TLT9_9ACTN|nr:AI-2E family transporter [Streptomyces gilvosporeus]